MKGAVAKCLGELVESKFGKDKWQQALEMTGMTKNKIFWPSEDIEDKQTLDLIGAVCKVTGISMQQAADAFGEYWAMVFAPKSFPLFYKGVHSARDFLLKMDEVHLTTTKQIENAHPPRFSYQWADNKTLLMTYKSNRGLIDIFVSLVKGVGKYYKENLVITKMSPTIVKIFFPN
jgi:hypothetical protein